MASSANGLIRSAGVLAVTGILTKLIGGIYRIPLTNVLGAEGMGIYQMIFPLFTLLITLASAGTGVAVMRLTSLSLSLGEESEAKEVYKVALRYVSVLGVFAVAVLYVFAPVVSRIQGNALVRRGYYAIAPAVALSAISGVMRGYCQARGVIGVVSGAQVSEQLTKAVFGLVLSHKLLPLGVEYAVVGALLGISISEVVNILIYAIFINRRGYSMRGRTLLHGRYNLARVIKSSIPIALGGIITPLGQLVDSVAVVNILSRSVGLSVATSSYGLFAGPVQALVNLPVMLSISLAVCVVPSVAGAGGRSESLGTKSSMSIRISMLVGIGGAATLVGVAPLLRRIYPSLTEEEVELAIGLLRVSAFSVVWLSGLQIYTALLQGIGLGAIPLKIALVAVSVKTLVGLALIGRMGIYGPAIGSLVGYGVSFLGCRQKFSACCPIKSIKNVSHIALSGVIMIVPVWILSIYDDGVVLVIATLLMGIVYLMTAIRHGFSREDMRNVPYGDKIAYALRMK